MGSMEVVGLRKVGEEMEGIHGAAAISSLLCCSSAEERGTESPRESPSEPRVRFSF